MTAPTSPRRHPALTAVHRRLVLHRRPLSATFAFLSVLLALAAITGGTPGASPDHAGSPVSGGDGAPIGTGQVEVPVRLSDPSVASVVTPGDVVDVVVADQRSAASVVAAEVVVTTVPTESSGPWPSGDGLLVVAATDDQALALAGAAARGPVTIILHRR